MDAPWSPEQYRPDESKLMSEDEKLEAMRKLCEDAEALDVLKQLWEGLIHPLEYARHICIIANRYNLTLLD
jgi:hypothetical protein